MFLTITNNKNIFSTDTFKIEFIDGGYIDVLEKVRSYIHMGYKLVSSPLFASSGMHRSPFKTILIEKDDSNCLDSLSVKTIEISIEKYKKYMDLRQIDYRNKESFAFMDKDLYLSMVKELKNL